LIDSGWEEDVPLDLDDLDGKLEQPKEVAKQLPDADVQHMMESEKENDNLMATTGWEDDHLDLDDIFTDGVPAPSQPVAAPSSTTQPLEAAKPQSTPAAAASGWDDDDDIAADFL